MLRDPQEWDPLPIWEAYHKEVPLFGVPEITKRSHEHFVWGKLLCSPVRKTIYLETLLPCLESNEKQKHVNSQKTWDTLVVPLGMRWCDTRKRKNSVTLHFQNLTSKTRKQEQYIISSQPHIVSNSCNTRLGCRHGAWCCFSLEIASHPKTVAKICVTSVASSWLYSHPYPCKFSIYSCLGGSFKYFMCSLLPGEMIQFDLRIFFQIGWGKTTN